MMKKIDKNSLSRTSSYVDDQGTLFNRKDNFYANIIMRRETSQLSKIPRIGGIRTRNLSELIPTAVY